MGAKQTKAQAGPVASVDGVAPPPPFKHAVILQGLPGAGKSTVQQRMQIPSSRMLQIDDRFLTQPPIYDSNAWSGNNRPYDARGDIDESIWNQGGRGSLSAIWSIVAHSTKAIVFVVDASNRATLAPSPDSPAPLPDSFVQGHLRKSPAEQSEVLATLRSRMTAKQLLASMFATGELFNRPLMVLANKQDQAGAVPPAEIAELLGLASIDDVDWRISGCNALTGEGLEEAFAWLNYVIASPSDFTKVRAKNQLVQNDARQKKWNADDAQRKLETVAATRRDVRLARGDVLPAPEAPWRTNGTRWAATPEQLAEFVLAPLTPDQPAPAVKADAIAPAADAAVVPTENQTSNTNDVNDTLQINVPTQTETTVTDTAAETAAVTAVVEPVVIVAAIAAVAAELSAENSRSNSDAAAARGESEVSSLARTESSMHSATGDVEGVNKALEGQPQQQSNEAPDANPDAIAAAPTAAKKSAYASLSSSFIVLPPVSAIPTVEMRLARKHWYSKKHMRPVPEIQKDIHKISNWGWGLL